MFERIRSLPRPLFFLFAGTMITRMGAFVFPYLAIYLSDSRGYGFETVGAVLSAGSLGLLAGNFAGGILTDRWSRKWTLVLALLLNASGFAGLAIHYAHPGFYAFFLFVGYLGSGLFTPAANTVIADIAPDRVRPFAYTVNYVCINLGMGMGPLLGGFIATVSFRWIFIGDVVTSLVCAALIVFGIRETKPTNDPANRTTAPARRMSRRVWKQNQTVVVFCLFYFFLIGPLMGMEFAVPLLIKNEFATSLIFVGVVYTINACCILAFSFPIERMIRDRNELLMMILSGVLWTLGMGVLLFGYSVAALMICTAIWTIGEIIASILVPTFIASRVPEEFKGRFMALNDIVRSLAGVVFPLGLGFLWTLHSARAVVLVIALMPLIGTVCYSLMFLRSSWHPRSVETAMKTESQ